MERPQQDVNHFDRKRPQLIQMIVVSVYPVEVNSLHFRADANFH